MSTDLEKIRQQRARAERKLAALKAREWDLKRRADTRKKIVLGGALMAAAKRDPRAAEMVARLASEYMSERDKQLFPPQPSPTPPATGGPMRIIPHDR